MDKGPFEVIVFNSDSEDEIQMFSKTNANYRNISAPLEITPKIQEKNYNSLLPEMKAIKAYSSKKNNNSVIKLGPVQGRTNNSRNKTRAQLLATDSEMVMPQYRFPHTSATDIADVQTLLPSSSVILDSPVRKIKVKRLVKKPRSFPTKADPPDSACPHPNESGYCLSRLFSPPVDQSSPDSTSRCYKNISLSFDDDEIPRWYENISPSYSDDDDEIPAWYENISNSTDDEEFVAEDSSKYDTMTKTVEVIRERSSVKNQTSTSDRFKNVSQNPDDENSWPSPTSPFNTLSQLDPAEFGAVVGLCVADADTRKRVNGPNRVLRKRPKK